MNFRSDNVSGIAPEILAAIAAANTGEVDSYGADPITERLTQRFAELFERDVEVFPVTTGTAANALALAALAPPWGAVYCHETSHIATNECGAPEFYTGGAKLIAVPGAHGKFAPQAAEALMGGDGVVHDVQPAVLSLSQTTEAGTVYTVDEVAAFGALARRRGLGLHMDGARFANAVVALGCSPATLTWRAGVDALSFGASKNGALAAEAVIFFDRRLATASGYRRKRGGHLIAKMRFLSAQLEAYLADGLWLRHAGHANRVAAHLARGLAALPGIRLTHPVQANEVFVELPEAAIRGLESAGFGFHRWGGEGSPCLRLVTAFNTRLDATEAFVAALRRHLGPG